MSTVMAIIAMSRDEWARHDATALGGKWNGGRVPGVHLAAGSRDAMHPASWEVRV